MSINFPEVIEELDSYISDMASMEKSLKKFADLDYFKGRQLNCLFLEKYKCSIYEARPTICRTYGMCKPCAFINNKEIHFKEESDLTKTQIIQGKRVIVKRPYPLFYYFSYFLSDDQYGGTMKKLSMIRSRSEKGYAEYSELEMR
ncbi:YkgJ family cysteine cluster protein [Enterococcus gallinarum]|uniref:YkgJ family cysteine cluster protein n=1 Tax=Enterococcus gallinarum TaxID=1353 RepID=UPI00107442EA|nr:YkgJ family cysteine cluster protein [Enterococcus gallinarum]MBF0726207.1 YkgJ family cysteine cluster protein [Enterococcus gallinarum]MBX8989969.1 YkgJ family cysteine cluster protein [Escherichia coli]NYS82308.1 YkgJ family cysteine cluster protein [Enterococcus gallinarum]TFV13932.1 YkgJ family cysteine cluster protein [Enterococcus gallinarum]